MLDSLRGGGEIKIKRHEVTVSFNDPSETGTLIQAQLFPVSPHHTANWNHMKAFYGELSETADPD